MLLPWRQLDRRGFPNSLSPSLLTKALTAISAPGNQHMHDKMAPLTARRPATTSSDPDLQPFHHAVWRIALI